MVIYSYYESIFYPFLWVEFSSGRAQVKKKITRAKVAVKITDCILPLREYIKELTAVKY